MNHFDPEIHTQIKSELASWTTQELEQRILDVYSVKDKAIESNFKSKRNKYNIFAKWELKKN
jgi:hypothetical protein